VQSATTRQACLASHFSGFCRDCVNISNWQAPAGDVAENHDMTKIGGLSAHANLALVAPQKRQ